MRVSSKIILIFLIKNLEEKQQLRVNLEMKVHDLWNQFNQAMKNYEEITEDRKRTFDDLKEKDEKSAKEIDMQMRKIQSLTVIKKVFLMDS